MTGAARAEVGLAPLLAGLSMATDLAMGQPAGHAARTCLLATRLAERLGLSAGQRADTFYVGLLRYVGCTADAHEVAAFAGGEIALAVGVVPFVMGEPDEEAAAVGLPGAGRAVAEAKSTSLAVHCEAARMLAGRLGLGPGVVDALQHGFERFDGAGHPAGLAEDAVPVPVRVCVLARDLEVWRHRADRATVREIVRRRRGRAYDPRVADAFLDDERTVLDRLDEDTWAQVFAAELHPVRVPADELDPLLEVVADFADLKLPCMLGHSRGVARIAADAAHACGLDRAAVTRVRRGRRGPAGPPRGGRRRVGGGPATGPDPLGPARRAHRPGGQGAATDLSRTVQPAGGPAARALGEDRGRHPENIYPKTCVSRCSSAASSSWSRTTATPAGPTDQRRWKACTRQQVEAGRADRWRPTPVVRTTRPEVQGRPSSVSGRGVRTPGKDELSRLEHDSHPLETRLVDL